MIDRYSTPDMRLIWSDGAKYARWHRVELAAHRHHAPPGDHAYVREHPAPTDEAVAYFEEQTGHDLVAFLRAWAVGADPDRWGGVHFGLTSSDVVDTALALGLRDSHKLIDRAAMRLFNDAWQHANGHLATLRVARTHGRPAEVASWGLLVRDIAEAADRAKAALAFAARPLKVCKMSGPVGTYAEHDRDYEEKVAFDLGLRSAMSATQVVGRDSIAAYAAACVGILGVVERLAVNVRLNSSRGLVAEGAADRRVGSSSMPQKRNPVTSEKLAGLARLGRGLLSPLLEDVALWDERDISHSSVERTALPDLLAVTEYALLEAAELIRDLEVDAAAMLSEVYAHYPELIKGWALNRAVEAGADRWETHTRLRGCFTLDEIEDVAGESAPPPAWFLRNLVPAWQLGLASEASDMV